MTLSDEEIRLIASAADLTHPGLKEVFTLWQGEKGEGVGPARLDLLSVPEMIDKFVTFDVPESGRIEDAVISFAGANLNKELGIELTGRSVAENDRYLGTQKLLRHVLERGVPLAVGPRRVGYEPESYLFVEHVCMPLSKDGAHVSGLFYAAHRDIPRDE